jgi:acylphosphatase
MKGYFLVKAKEADIVTEKGVRALIMEMLLNAPFSRASVTNIDNKTVQIQIEGDEKQIKLFIKKIEKVLIEQLGNPTVYFSGFTEDSSLEIPNLVRSSQALMVGQLQKGIGVQLEIISAIKELQTITRGLPIEIARAIKEK